MPTITPQQFVSKWSQIQQKETAVSQSHFNDLCRLVGHLTPLEFDSTGEHFSFETQTTKTDGGKGFADVFFRDHFIWEYKGPHKDLEKAYRQLQLYRESLDNPPLLITSDIHTIVIHTNFNNYPTQRHEITFDDVLTSEGLEKLRWVFFSPDKFKPAKTQQQITKASAETFVKVADAMKAHQKVTGEQHTPEQLAHFMVRLLFCLFAEDMGLLPANIFTQIIQAQGQRDTNLRFGLRNLFREMRGGGTFGFYQIRHFDGTLFDDEFVPDIPHDLAQALLQAARQDWSEVDPSIFGTLFERVIDEGKRAQLGAHYTSESDIMLIVEPVLMAPLKARWEETRLQANSLALTAPDAAHQLLDAFAGEVAAVRVLDPACGSGNFLYVALRELLDLQKQVIAYAARKGLPPIALSVSPKQLYGIELNPYAHELAQITAWIGYLQWRNENGFGEMEDPILRPLRHIRRMDAILAYDENGNPTEPEWPEAEVIIGNPPFLGDKKMIPELGEDYVLKVRQIYKERLSGQCDLVCYWFEKSRELIDREKVQRAGLLATSSIRGGANRSVLDRIKATGDIFWAESSRDWILEGAAVDVSMVGFDNGTQSNKQLDGKSVTLINADLTSSTDLTIAQALSANEGIAFIGTQKGGPFDIDQSTAYKFIADTSNPDRRTNDDIVRPWINGFDITQRPRNMWIIDFGAFMSIEEASKYLVPFEYVQKNVFPKRKDLRRDNHKVYWWIHAESRPGMRTALGKLSRYIATPRVSKHRVFVWQEVHVLPDSAVVAIARQDNYFFGVLHSRLHEIWALRLGTSLEDRPRYTPSTTFETFPFPWPPGQEPPPDHPQVAAISQWARALVAWRDAWLNPPPPTAGVIDVTYQKTLKNRTLTNLYNGLQYYRETVKAGGLFSQSEFGKVTRHSVSRSDIEELDDIHTALDRAVLDAYGWPHNLTDEQILEKLLALNLERAGGG